MAACLLSLFKKKEKVLQLNLVLKIKNNILFHVEIPENVQKTFQPQNNSSIWNTLHVTHTETIT